MFNINKYDQCSPVHMLYVISAKWPDVPAYPYQAQSDSFAYSSIFTMTESIEALSLVRAECNNLLANMSFFNFKLSKLFRIQEFENLQEQATNVVSVVDLSAYSGYKGHSANTS